MINRRLILNFPACVILTLCYLRASSQVTITGPGCVVPGTIYQYLISGKWDSASTMQICLTGGTISGKAVTCTANSKPVAFVRIEWDSGTGGSIQVTSTSGNSNLPVTIAAPLTGGLIVDSAKTKSIAYNSMPDIIHCTPSTGGSCTSHYTYQWQESSDIVTWSDISGANSQDLVLSYACKQATYFRRRVTETSSSSVAYSDYEIVFVAAPPPPSAAHSYIKSVPDGTEDLAVNFPKNKNKNY
jgi:hypothetical protein